MLDGKMMIWGSNREGTRQQGGDIASADVYGMFFTRAAFDRFNLTKEEFALVKEQEEKEEKDKKDGEEKDGKKPAAKPDKEEKPKEVVMDWDEPAGTPKQADDPHFAGQRLGAVQGRREALLPHEFRQGERSLGDGIAHQGDEALQQARGEADGQHGTFGRRQVHFPPGRRQADEGGDREAASRSPSRRTARWS